MPRLTKAEIETTLLSGRALSWKAASGKVANIQLSTVAQRRLFEFLLKHADQQGKGCTPDFIEGLSDAYLGIKDPSSAITLNDGSQMISSWRLESLKSHNFGGVNSWGGDLFQYDFNCESLTIEGPNGSGKSSFAAAVIWLFTGTRPRDHVSASTQSLEPVLNQQDKEIGKWPPLAAYPSKVADLLNSPEVRVDAVLKSHDSRTVAVYRELKAGVITTNIHQVIDIPDVFLSTGLSMPSRIGHIRLREGANGLTEAVQQLTGLDEVIMLGELCDWLTHGAREYKSYSKVQKLTDQESIFSTSIQSAKVTLAAIGRDMPIFEPAAAKEDTDPMALLGNEISAIAKTLTDGLSNDLAPELQATDLTTQKRPTQSIDYLKAKLDLGLEGLDAWQCLAQIALASAGTGSQELLDAIAVAEAALGEAATADQAAQLDNRRQLKALAAVWHQEHAEGNIENCPLCDQSLKNVPALQAELEALMAAGAAATRKFSDNINQISETLRVALPEVVKSQSTILKGQAPAELIVTQFKAIFGLESANTKALPAFAALAESFAKEAPFDALKADTLQDAAKLDGHQKLLYLIAWSKRCEELARWMHSNRKAWENWWQKLSAPLSDGLPISNESQELNRETLSRHLARLASAMAAAEPYAQAIIHIKTGIAAARKVLDIRAEQTHREDICLAISPLKELKSIGEATARQAIDELSTRIQAILKGALR